MYLGDSQRKLYGVYHAPSRPTRRAHAVLLCYPGIQEYNSSHWAYRRLAGMLARDGHHVLRFDYFGTGDSAGEVEEGLPDVWMDDIRQAALELRDISGARQVSLVGKRLGGTLAGLACQKSLQARTLVLWDPVLSGSAYVAELESWNARRNLLLLHPEYSRGAPRDELLGYRFPRALRSALEGLVLGGSTALSAEKVTIFSGSERADLQRLRDQLVTTGIATHLAVVDQGEAETKAGAAKAELGGALLASIADELRGALAA